MARLACGSIIPSVTRDLQDAIIDTMPASEKPTFGESEIDAEEVRLALERICASANVAGSEKLVQFLRFVVETSLSGNARDLKETIIGISVFARSPDYDPKADTVVRSQAWRLRSKLAEYYRTEGANDPVIIDMPKGSYVPVFSRRRQSAK
jgi:hypothetical protein